MSAGSYSRPRQVAVVDASTENDDGGAPLLYLARLPNGPLVVLEGPGALIWRAAVGGSGDGGGSPHGLPEDEAIVASVAGQVGLPAGKIRADVRSFLADLVGRDLLHRAEEP